MIIIQHTSFAYMDEKFQIKLINGKECIFDIQRKKFVFLTPEEWVRQYFLHFIIYDKKYPASMIAVEKQLTIGSLVKRFDILIYKQANPWMLVECKSEQIDINSQTLSQILAYNTGLKVQYLTITNGKCIYCFDTEKRCWRDELPNY